MCACACLAPFCLCMSHANVLIFVDVIAHVCLLRERVHTLAITRALAHALALVHSFARYNWFCRLLAPSSL